MRINGSDITGNQELDLQATRSSREVADSTGSTNVGSAQTSDSIALTGLSDLTQLALSAGASQRADLVQQLKLAVETNQYRVDPEAVSRALIAAHTAGQ